MYTVYDSGIRAASLSMGSWIKAGFNVDTDYSNSSFNSFDEAVSYAKKWLGKGMTNPIPDNWNGSPWNYAEDDCYCSIYIQET